MFLMQSDAPAAAENNSSEAATTPAVTIETSDSIPPVVPPPAFEPRIKASACINSTAWILELLLIYTALVYIFPCLKSLRKVYFCK